MRREIWESDSGGGFIEAGHVLVGAEEANITIAILVGLHSLEAFEGVVEDAGCRVEGEVLVRGYSRGEPTRGGCPLY